MSQKKLVKKHPPAIRWMHWINFPVLAIMIWSGLLIYWANDIYKVNLGFKTITFFDPWFYTALHIPQRLAEGMSFHFTFMWIFAINGLVYFLYLMFSKQYKLIFPNKRSFQESWLVLKHDILMAFYLFLLLISGKLFILIFRDKRSLSESWRAVLQQAHSKGGQLPPQKKYNAAQRMAYTGVIIMGFGSILTGLAIYKPVQLYWLCAALGGYEWARAEHFILTILFSLFFVVHLLQVILAGWNNFRGMVTGFEVKDIPPVIAETNDEATAIANEAPLNM